MRRTIELARGVDEVFAYLSDFTHTQEWDPGTVTTTRTDSGPTAEGAQFHNVSQFRGRQTELDYVLTTFAPGRHLVFTGNNKTCTATDDMTFSGDASRTTLQYEASLRFHGLVRLAEPFLKKGFEKVADETVVQLKRTLA